MGHLDVTPAELLTVADRYSELAGLTAALPERAAAEVSRVMATHGPIGYPAATGIAKGVDAQQPPVAAKADDFVQYSTRFAEHTGTYASEDQAAADRIQAVDFKTAPPDAPDDTPKKPHDKDYDKDSEGDKKPGGKRSVGKGSKTHIEPGGEVEQQWGHPTEPHEIWPDVPNKTGTFDEGRGEWEWHGPGRQGQATASDHTDGVAGEANADAWLVKGEGSWQRDVLGNPLTSSANGEIGTHNNAHSTVTDHGVSAGAETFFGAELGGKVNYDMGPIDISLGGALQAGAGGSGGFDFGMQDGKLVIGGNLGIAWGPGGKIAPQIAVDPDFVVDGITKAGEFLTGLFN